MSRPKASKYVMLCGSLCMLAAMVWSVICLQPRVGSRSVGHNVNLKQMHFLMSSGKVCKSLIENEVMTRSWTKHSAYWFVLLYLEKYESAREQALLSKGIGVEAIISDICDGLSSKMKPDDIYQRLVVRYPGQAEYLRGAKALLGLSKLNVELPLARKSTTDKVSYYDIRSMMYYITHRSEEKGMMWLDECLEFIKVDAIDPKYRHILRESGLERRTDDYVDQIRETVNSANAELFEQLLLDMPIRFFVPLDSRDYDGRTLADELMMMAVFREGIEHNSIRAGVEVASAAFEMLYSLYNTPKCPLRRDYAVRVLLRLSEVLCFGREEQWVGSVDEFLNNYPCFGNEEDTLGGPDEYYRSFDRCRWGTMKAIRLSARCLY